MSNELTTETIDKMKGLIRTSRALRTFWDNFHAVIHKPKCDKHKAAFNVDDRFTVFSSGVHFDAYTGYYGSSSCSTFTNGISGKLASQYFVQAIENMKVDIFNEMAALMEMDANDLKDKARDDIAQLQQLVENSCAKHIEGTRNE